MSEYKKLASQLRLIISDLDETFSKTEPSNLKEKGSEYYKELFRPDILKDILEKVQREMVIRPDLKIKEVYPKLIGILRTVKRVIETAQREELINNI